MDILHPCAYTNIRACKKNMYIYIYTCTVLCISDSVQGIHCCCKEVVYSIIPIYTHPFRECPPQLTKNGTCSKTHWIGPGSASKQQENSPHFFTWNLKSTTFEKGNHLAKKNATPISVCSMLVYFFEKKSPDHVLFEMSVLVFFPRIESVSVSQQLILNNTDLVV